MSGEPVPTGLPLSLPARRPGPDSNTKRGLGGALRSSLRRRNDPDPILPEVLSEPYRLSAKSDFKDDREARRQPLMVLLFSFLYKRISKDLPYYDIDITPPPEQINSWVGGIPVTATGMYYPFGTETGIWKMRGLQRCTAVFIVVSIESWLARQHYP